MLEQAPIEEEQRAMRLKTEEERLVSLKAENERLAIQATTNCVYRVPVYVPIEGSPKLTATLCTYLRGPTPDCNPVYLDPVYPGEPKPDPPSPNCRQGCGVKLYPNQAL